jgi:hypothetical protein
VCRRPAYCLEQAAFARGERYPRIDAATARASALGLGDVL